jgi:hypothetical protein
LLQALAAALARHTSSMSSSSSLSAASSSAADAAVALANEIQAEAGLLLLEIACQLPLSLSSPPPAPTSAAACIACIDTLSHSSLLAPSPSFANASSPFLPPLLALACSNTAPHQQSLNGSVTLLLSYLAAAAEPASHGSLFISNTCAPKIMQALQVVFSTKPNNFTPCDSFLPVGRDSRTTCQCRPAAAGCHEGGAVVIESFRRGRGPSFSRQDSVGFII